MSSGLSLSDFFYLILIMTSENGSGARPKDILVSVSSGRSFRNLPIIDYKNFSEGDFCSSTKVFVEILL